MPDTVTRGFPKNAEHPVEDLVMDDLPPFSLEPSPIERVSKADRPFGACTTDTFQCWRRSLRRRLKTGVTETKPYLDYAQTPKTLCLAFNQNTRWTTGNCGPRRDVLFTMGNATTTNSAVWCSRSQRCGALQRNHPGIESSSFLPSAPER